VKGAKLTIALCLAIVAAIGAVTLSGSPPRVVRSSAKGEDEVGVTFSDASACQTNEVLPAGVQAIRLGLVAPFGPNVLVRAYSGSRILMEGRRAADWTGSSVTLLVKPLSHAVSGVKLCFELRSNSERVRALGVFTPPREAAVTSGGEPLQGRLSVEYLAAGRRSWWSLALSIARHMGIGHALSGTWVALLVAALMAAVAALTIRFALRELP
jgi:hypothetical protein